MKKIIWKSFEFGTNFLNLIEISNFQGFGSFCPQILEPLSAIRQSCRIIFIAFYFFVRRFMHTLTTKRHVFLGSFDWFKRSSTLKKIQDDFIRNLSKQHDFGHDFHHFGVKFWNFNNFYRIFLQPIVCSESCFFDFVFPTLLCRRHSRENERDDRWIRPDHEQNRYLINY